MSSPTWTGSAYSTKGLISSLTHTSHLEAQIHRLAPRASLLDLLAEPIIAGEHFGYQERRRWQQYLGGDNVGNHISASDDGNPRIGLTVDSSSTPTDSISSLSEAVDEAMLVTPEKPCVHLLSH